LLKGQLEIDYDSRLGDRDLCLLPGISHILAGEGIIAGGKVQKILSFMIGGNTPGGPFDQDGRIRQNIPFVIRHGAGDTGGMTGEKSDRMQKKKQ